MATLTPEQRERKRQRDAEYRAKKKAAQVEQYSVQFDADAEQAIQDAFAGNLSLSQLGKALAGADIKFSPVIETETPVLLKEITQSELDRFAAQSLLRAKVRDADLGDYVTAPVTGMQAIVARVYRDKGRLLTEDGEHMWAGQCGHSTEERADKGTIVFFEQVGYGKDFADGTTGLVHRFSRCNKVVQTS